MMKMVRCLMEMGIKMRTGRYSQVRFGLFTLESLSSLSTWVMYRRWPVLMWIGVIPSQTRVGHRPPRTDARGMDTSVIRDVGL
jgi:hypothetical protein